MFVIVIYIRLDGLACLVLFGVCLWLLIGWSVSFEVGFGCILYYSLLALVGWLSVV